MSCGLWSREPGDTVRDSALSRAQLDHSTNRYSFKADHAMGLGRRVWGVRNEPGASAAKASRPRATRRMRVVSGRRAKREV